MTARATQLQIAASHFPRVRTLSLSSHAACDLRLRPFPWAEAEVTMTVSVAVIILATACDPLVTHRRATVHVTACDLRVTHLRAIVHATACDLRVTHLHGILLVTLAVDGVATQSCSKNPAAAVSPRHPSPVHLRRRVYRRGNQQTRNPLGPKHHLANQGNLAVKRAAWGTGMPRQRQNHPQ